MWTSEGCECTLLKKVAKKKLKMECTDIVLSYVKSKSNKTLAPNFFVGAITKEIENIILTKTTIIP